MKAYALRILIPDQLCELIIPSILSINQFVQISFDQHLYLCELYKWFIDKIQESSMK